MPSGNERIIARVISVRRRKTVTFLECRHNDNYVQVVMASSDPRCHAGDFVAFEGSWAPSRSRALGAGQAELLASSAELLSRPTDSAWSELERKDHRLPLLARARALAAAERQLREHDFIRVETPVLMGQEAAVGPTRPFAVQHGQEQAYLCVNNLLAQQQFQAAGLASVYQISRLFWAQRFHNRFSLNEFSLLELSRAGASVDDLRSLAETLLEAMRMALLAELGSGARPYLELPLFRLPVVSHEEALALVRRRGSLVNDEAHVLPPMTDEILCRELQRPGYWLVEAPAQAAPFYARRCDRDGREVACSLELRLRGAPDAGAGSEWNIDVDSATARLAGRVDDAAVEYLNMLRRGFPPAAGFSMGLDRVLMHLLSVENIRQLVAAPRKVTTFRDAPASPQSPRQVTSSAPPLGRPKELAEAARFSSGALRALSVSLEARGFLPVVTSLLQANSDAAHTVPCVDWFGRQVQLVGLDGAGHRDLVCAGPARIYEVGPRWPSESWRTPAYVLRATWICDDLEDVRQLGTDLLGLLGCQAKPQQSEVGSENRVQGWAWRAATVVFAEGNVWPASVGGLRPPLGELWLNLHQLGLNLGAAGP